VNSTRKTAKRKPKTSSKPKTSITNDTIY
jgi:hypothetical protein